MLAIFAGALGFVSMIASDWAGSRGSRAGRIACALLAVLLVAPSFAVLLVSGPRLSIPFPIRLAAGIVVTFSSYLLLRSLVFDLMPKRVPGSATGLATGGTYALSRHPGVLWLFSFQASVGLSAGSLSLLAALPVWTLMNIALVLAEDRIFLPAAFGAAYDEYKREVPFLVPNAESLRRFMRAERGRCLGKGNPRSDPASCSDTDDTDTGK